MLRPRKHYVKIDGNVSFTCDSHYTPTWVFNGHHLPANAVVDDIDTNILHISNAIPGNYGFYYCIGHDGISHYTFISRSLLEVLGMYLTPVIFIVGTNKSSYNSIPHCNALRCKLFLDAELEH